MGNTWVLHTETKGTGAQMVPLESITKRGGSAPDPVLLKRPRKPRPKPAEPPAAPAPRRFRVVDVMTRVVLAEDADARATLEVLGDVRRIVDVNVFVWEDDEDRWRLLTYAEQRRLLDVARTRAAAS